MTNASESSPSAGNEKPSSTPLLLSSKGSPLASQASRQADQFLQEAIDHPAAPSLLTFIQQAWHVLEPRTSFVKGKHLEAITDHLEAVTHGQIRNLLVNVPPRHCKSLTVCVFWPVWEWLAHPERRWLFASYALSLSVRDSLRCRRLIRSPWFQKNFGSRFQLCNDQNAKMRFDNDRGGVRIATSVGGSATGEGGDRVVVDDPHNVTFRDSDAVRTAALEWWDQTMSTRLNDPKTGARVIVMQRVHEHDLSGHVLQQGGYTHLNLPAEFEAARRCSTIVLDGKHEPWTDWRTTEGGLLWRERIGPQQIAEAKLRLGPSGYAGQYQQRPAPAGGGRFKAAWFRYYALRAGTYYLGAGNNKESPPVPIEVCDRFAVMDPAGTAKDQNQRACYTVIQVWDVTPAHEMILVYQYRQQVESPDAASDAIEIAGRYKVSYLAVEKDGLGLGVVQTIRRSGITVKPIRARGSKEARSETAEIRMAAGMIYLPEDAPYRFALEQELLHFPNGEYADQVDALAHAAMLVQKNAGPPKLSKLEPDATDLASEVTSEVVPVVAQEDDSAWTDLA